MYNMYDAGVWEQRDRVAAIAKMSEDFARQAKNGGTLHVHIDRYGAITMHATVGAAEYGPDQHQMYLSTSSLSEEFARNLALRG